jgi:hypothetical protein
LGPYRRESPRACSIDMMLHPITVTTSFRLRGPSNSQK